MNIARIPLQPHTRFHFGEFKIDNNVALSHTSVIAHSDLLFSSLVNNYLDLSGNADDFVRQFVSGKAKISSLYYYLKNLTNQEIVYLLPKPVFLDLFSKRDGHHKLRNSIRFVSKGVWEQGFDSNEWLDDTKYRLFQNKEILLTLSEYQKLNLSDESHFVYKIVDMPKSPIREVIKKPGDKDPSIFYQADVEIGKIPEIEIGLYFLFEADEEMIRKIKTAVNIMAYSGIGGEKNNTGRTMGLPVFDESFSIAFISNNASFSNGFTNISLLNPKDEEELQNVSYNQTFLRGGRETGSRAYKVIRMIKEGALLQQEVEGRAVEIGTDRNGIPALRNGICFSLPIKYPERV